MSNQGIVNLRRADDREPLLRYYSHDEQIQIGEVVHHGDNGTNACRL